MYTLRDIVQSHSGIVRVKVPDRSNVRKHAFGG